MAEQLYVSEGHVVDSSGNRIATLVDLAESERITALDERLATLENAFAVYSAAPPAPEDPNAPSPPGGPLKIHVGPEDTPDGKPIPTPPDVSSPGSPFGVDGVA
jgi:hypothetical protein